MSETLSYSGMVPAVFHGAAYILLYCERDTCKSARLLSQSQESPVMMRWLFGGTRMRGARCYKRYMYMYKMYM